MEPLEVFGLGQCSVDRLCVLERYPDDDAKAEFSDMVVQCGGPAATATFALARWSRRCGFCGVVGDDEDGRRIREDLEGAGVDASFLIERAGERSQYAFIAIERASGRRRIYWRRPSGAPPAPGEVDAPGVDVLLTDGLFAEASVEAARRARRVVVDAGTLREGTRAMLDHAHVFVASEAFARAFAGGADPEGACRKMHEHGVEVAGVTLGARGYVASFSGTVIERPAHPTDAVDTTGCGDLFHAGLVEGMLRGWDWARAFDFAAWAAARCASALGGRAGIPPVRDYPR